MATLVSTPQIQISAPRIILMLFCKKLSAEKHTGETKTKKARDAFEREYGIPLKGAPIAVKGDTLWGGDDESTWWVLRHRYFVERSGRAHTETIRYEPITPAGWWGMPLVR